METAATSFDAETPHWVPLIFKVMDTIQVSLDTVLGKVDDLTEFNTSITKRVDDLEESVKFVAKKYDDQKKELDDLKELHQDLKETVKAIQDQNTRLSAATGSMFKRMDTNEQHSRNECLLLHGIPEAEGEKPPDTASKFAAVVRDQLKIELAPEEIKRAHRLGPARQDGKNRPIIARFANMGKRNHVYFAKKCLKGSGKVITENLTAHRVKVLADAEERYGRKNVWTTEGRIVAKNDSGKININLYGYV